MDQHGMIRRIPVSKERMLRRDHGLLVMYYEHFFVELRVCGGPSRREMICSQASRMKITFNADTAAMQKQQKVSDPFSMR